ncbi:MAG: hypothetical protein ACK4ZN_12410 [Oceanibaculum sp.]
MTAERDEADGTDSAALLQGLLSSHREIMQMEVGVERFRAMNTLFDETRLAIRTVDSRITKLSQERNSYRDEIAFIRRHQARLTTLRGYLSGTYRSPDRVIANLDGFALNHPPSKLKVMFKDPDRLGIVRGASFLGLIKSGERKEAVDNYNRNILKALDGVIGDHRAFLHSLATDWSEKQDEASRLLDETAEVKKTLGLFLKELQVEHVRIGKQLLPVHVEQLQPAEKKLVDWLQGQKEGAAAAKLEE